MTRAHVITTADGYSINLLALPKAELHLHFEGAMSRDSAEDLAARYRLPLPPLGTHDGLGAFVGAYELARDLIGTRADLTALAADLALRQHNQGIVWTECYLIPRTYDARLGTDEQVLDAVLAGFERAGLGHTVGIILGVNRSRPKSEVADTVDLALRRWGTGVVALGLAGDEARFPGAEFQKSFAPAIAAGLPIVPHAGEGAGSESVRNTVEALRPSRISHGLAAASDPAVIAQLIEQDVCLDLAPSSNVALGCCASVVSHPLPALSAAGVAVTLNSDTPLFTGRDLVAEYAECAAAWGLGAKDVVALAQTSLQRSLCPEPLRATAIARLGYFAETLLRAGE